jgi:RHS repeat-associated protein
LALGALLLLGFVGDAHGNVRYRSQFDYDAFNRPTSIAVGMDLSGGLQGAGGIGGLLARSEMSAYGDASHAYYHSDALGNVTTLVDSNQRITARYLYDPFGNTLSAVGPLAQANTYQFSSKELHANSGFYYYGFRFYDPGTQRFLNRDPLGEAGGMNLYGFVGNNPMGAVDAFGLIAGIADDTDEELDQRLANLSMPGRGGLLGATHGYNKPMRDWNNKHWDDSLDTLKCAAKDAAKEAGKLALTAGIGAGLSMAAEIGMAAKLIPNLGRKLEYILGNATGAAHNLERTAEMARQMQRIGLPDTLTTRQVLTEHLTAVLNNPSNIARIQANGNIVRESFLMGPIGGAKLESIWNGAKLITVNIFGGH